MSHAAARGMGGTGGWSARCGCRRQLKHAFQPNKPASGVVRGAGGKGRGDKAASEQRPRDEAKEAADALRAARAPDTAGSKRTGLDLEQKHLSTFLALVDLQKKNGIVAGTEEAGAPGPQRQRRLAEWHVPCGRRPVLKVLWKLPREAGWEIQWFLQPFPCPRYLAKKQKKKIKKRHRQLSVFEGAGVTESRAEPGTASAGDDEAAVEGESDSDAEAGSMHVDETRSRLNPAAAGLMAKMDKWSPSEALAWLIHPITPEKFFRFHHMSTEDEEEEEEEKRKEERGKRKEGGYKYRMERLGGWRGGWLKGKRMFLIRFLNQ
jgi:hypothetical protein